jgi:glycosyltransferase involved in cell wall biosynthesis
MPAHNEQDYLARAVAEVVTGLRARSVPFEVIVCENGSTDRTPELALELAKAYPEVRRLTSPRADYGAALRQGFLAARGEVVANFDVDYVDLSFLDASLTLLEADDGPAVVVASKRSPGAVDTRPLGRRVVTATFSLLLRFGYGLTVSDTHGMKVLRRADLVTLVNDCRCDADLFDTELVLRAERAGVGVSELPVTVRDTRPPRSPIITRVLRSTTGLVRLRAALRHADRASNRLVA